jgi:hypothetical protein
LTNTTEVSGTIPVESASGETVIALNASASERILNFEISLIVFTLIST